MSAQPNGPQLPTVGIVVAALNAEAYLEQTLLSIEAQTMSDWSCVVVDDGSTDGTAAIAARFASRDPRFIVHSQPNAGLPAARNKGIEVLPESRWLAFIDSDDTWLPDAIEVLLSVASKRPDAVAVYGLAEYMDEAGHPVRAGEHPAVQRDRRRPGRFDLRSVEIERDGTFDVIMVSGTIWPPAVGVYDWATVTRAGRFDPAQRFVEDWDLYLRMSRFGPFVPVDRQVAWYRQHAASLTRRDRQMAYYYARVRWKAWKSPQNTDCQRRMVRRVWFSLQARAVLWAASAALRSARARDWRETWAGVKATALFAAQLTCGRPTEPTERSARYIAKFVAPRRSRSRSNRRRVATGAAQ